MCFCGHLQMPRRQLLHAQVSELIIVIPTHFFSLTSAHFGGKVE